MQYTYPIKIASAIRAKKKKADVHLNRVTKNNGVTRIGMLIWENGSNIVPNIYLEKFYQEFQEGASLEEIAKQILKVNREHRCITSFPVSTLKSFDEVKKDIVYRLINRERNIKYLNTVPHENTGKRFPAILSRIQEVVDQVIS